MVKILLDLTDEEDRLVEIYKIVNRLKTKQEAIKKMIRYFSVKIEPKNFSKEEDYYKKSLDFSGGKQK